MAEQKSWLERARETAGQAAETVADAARQTKNAAVGAVVQTTGAGISPNEEAIATKAGLKGGTLTYFKAEVDQNPELKKVFSHLENDMAQGDKYNGFLQALGDRFTSEAATNRENVSKRTIVDSIGEDIRKNPALATKLEEVIKNNPDGLAKIIPSYQPGQLETVLQAVSAPSQPAPSKPAPAQQAPVQTAAAQTASAQPASSQPASQPASTQTAPAAQSAATAPKVDAVQSVIDSFLTNDKELLQNRVNNTMNEGVVVGISQKLAVMAVDKYGADEARANGFLERINTDPKLQKAISDNFKEHPDFVKRLVKLSKDDSSVPDSVRQTAKKELETIMEHPEKLADSDYITKLDGQMQMANGLNKFANMFGNMFGVDMNGMMSNIGEFFQGFIQKIMDFIGNLTGNPNMISGSNMGLGMTQNLHHSMYETQSMRVLPDENGKLFHEVKKGSSSYQEQNQIEVQGADGKPIKVVPTDGAIKISENANGDVRLRVAASYDEAGNVRYTRDVSLSKEGFDQYKAQVAIRGAAEPVKDVPNREPMKTVYLDPKNGMEVADPTVKPQQTGPQSTVGQDMDILKNMSSRNLGLDLMTGV